MPKQPLTTTAVGGVACEDLYDNAGRLLLSKGEVLTLRRIERLVDIGVGDVEVRESHVPGSPEDGLLSAKAHNMVSRRVRGVLEDACKSSHIDAARVHAASRVIAREVYRNRNLVLPMARVRQHDEYTFEHSVSVGTYAALIGVRLNLDQESLEELTAGALVHDVGKMLIDKRILNKPGRLTPEEFQVMRQHPQLSREILSNGQSQMPATAVLVAGEHHERYDGSGYPAGLRGWAIHRFARIVAVADVYDALTGNRIYRPAIPPHVAFEMMREGSGTHFESRILDLFLEHVPVYPEGAVVNLSDGSVGVVIHVTRGKQMRPLVHLIRNSDGTLSLRDAQIDLIDRPDVDVAGVMAPDAADELLDRFNRALEEIRGTRGPLKLVDNDE